MQNRFLKLRDRISRAWLFIPFIILLWGLVLLYMLIQGQPLPGNTEPADIWWILGIGAVSSFVSCVCFKLRSKDREHDTFWPDGRSRWE